MDATVPLVPLKSMPVTRCRECGQLMPRERASLAAARGYRCGYCAVMSLGFNRNGRRRGK